jgi:hypothetical protein
MAIPLWGAVGLFVECRVMPNESIPVSISGLRLDEWVNPFGATPEELLAAALEENGLLAEGTRINGRSGREAFRAFSRKRSLFQQAIRLGTLLVRERVISREHFQDALAHQRGNARPLVEILLDWNLCNEEAVNQALAKEKTISPDA